MRDLSKSPNIRNVHRRALASPTYQATATGGATSAADSNEDDALTVGGEARSSINSDAATAQTEFEATGSDQVDYNAAIEAEVGFSFMTKAFALLGLLFALLF